MDSEQQTKIEQALAVGGAHEVLVTIGKCQPNFPLAAVVTVDGKETIRGGLDTGQDTKFIEMIREKAKPSKSDVTTDPRNADANFVVPCPPPG